MTPTILVVDDELDLEALVLQKFRRQIREGAVSFVFAHDGLEALESIEQHPLPANTVSHRQVHYCLGVRHAKLMIARSLPGAKCSGRDICIGDDFRTGHVFEAVHAGFNIGRSL